VSSSESSSQKSMIIGSMTLLSTQFSLQYSFSILTTCSSAFVYTSFVVLNTSCPCKNQLMPALKNPSLVVLDNASYHNVKCSSAFVYTSFVVLNTSCPCKLAILSVLCTTGVFFCFIFSYNTFLVSVAEKGMLCCVR
jgi:hypothetical protein